MPLFKRFFKRSSDTSVKETGKLSIKEIDSSSSDEESDGFEAYCVIEFKRGCSEAARAWIVNKLTSHRNQGGAHLMARSALDEHHEGDHIPQEANIHYATRPTKQYIFYPAHSGARAPFTPSPVMLNTVPARGYASSHKGSMSI